MFSALNNFNFVRVLGYLAFSASWLAFAYFFGQLIPDRQLWFALLVTFLFGLPIYFAAIYAVTIQRIHLASQFKKLGILHWLFTRRILAYIWWLLWSVIFAFLLLFYLGSAEKQEWMIFFAAIPVFAIIYAVFFPLATREYKPYIAVYLVPSRIAINPLRFHPGPGLLPRHSPLSLSCLFMYHRLFTWMLGCAPIWKLSKKSVPHNEP